MRRDGQRFEPGPAGRPGAARGGLPLRASSTSPDGYPSGLLYILKKQCNTVHGCTTIQSWADREAVEEAGETVWLPNSASPGSGTRTRTSDARTPASGIVDGCRPLRALGSHGET